MKGPLFTILRLGAIPVPLTLSVGQYQDGSGNTAVQIVAADDEGDSYATVSVNVPDVTLPAGEFVFKTYSENEGLHEELIALGLIEDTGEMFNVGMAGPQPVCRLK